MPPKNAGRARAPVKAGGKKGNKGKNLEAKKAKAAAREQKRLKKLKKFSNLMYENEPIWTKGRGELEVIAWSLQRQVETDRGERIAMMYERDWLFEMTKIYLQKIRHLRRKMESQVQELNSIQLDLEGAKLFTRLTRKQAMYTTMMKTSEIEFRQRKRTREMKKLVETLIKYFHNDQRTLDRMIAALPAQREKRKEWKAGTLQPLSQRMNEIYDEADAYIERLRKMIADMGKHRKVMLDSELLQDVDEVSEMTQTSVKRNELMSSAAKDLYAAQAHNSLTLIMQLLNHWDDMDEDAEWRVSNRKIFDIAKEFLAPIYESTVHAFIKAKKRAIRDAQLIQVLDTTYKSLRVSEHYLRKASKAFGHTYAEFQRVSAGRKWLTLDYESMYEMILKLVTGEVSSLKLKMCQW